MHGTKEIIQEATALPVEERVIVIDSILRTLNLPNPDIDKEWVAFAKRRLAELRSGRSCLRKMTFDFHPEAETEFLEAIAFYEECEPGLGEDFSLEVYSSVQNVLSYPLA